MNARDLAFAWGILRRRPFDVLVQVTNRCNMTCTFCDFPQNAASPREELTLDEFRSLADQLAEMGRCLISIEGGEPMVRHDLVGIVRTFARRHLPALYTNGWYMTAEKAEELWDAGLHIAGVSIDFPDARHDAKRGLPGALDRARRAVDLLRDAAPRGGRQVHVVSVLMRENADDAERLLQLSASHGVGHLFTLLSEQGFRRGRRGQDHLPEAPIGARLAALWDKYPHWRFWRAYVEKLDDYLTGGPMPTCRAGIQSFNVDHVGNVSACIERIDKPVGNIRQEPLAAIHTRLAADRAEVERCQKCWTACRGFSQMMGNGGSVRSWAQMAARIKV